MKGRIAGRCPVTKCVFDASTGNSKNTWSSSLTCQLAVEPAQGEGGDVDRVVRVGDRQLGRVGLDVRAGRGPHWPGQVTVC